MRIGPNGRPVRIAERHLAAVFLGLDTLGGQCESVMQVVEDLGEPGSLGWSKLLRERRQSFIADDGASRVTLMGPLTFRSKSKLLSGAPTIVPVCSVTGPSGPKACAEPRFVMPAPAPPPLAIRWAISSSEPKQDKRAANSQAVAMPQPANLHDHAVDARAIGAVEVGQDNIVGVNLHLGVKPADALVVEPQDVPFLTTDGDRRLQIPKDPSLVDSFQDLKSQAHRFSRPQNGCTARIAELMTRLGLYILGCQRLAVNSDVAGRQPGRWRNHVICRLAKLRLRVCTWLIVSAKVALPSRCAKTPHNRAPGPPRG